MEKKKAKIVSIDLIVRSYPGKSGTMFIHNIGFENDPQKWAYHSAKETCDSFKVGDIIEGEFNIEQKGTYTNYNFKPVTEKAPFKGGGAGRVVDEGAIIMQSCISSACNLFAEKGGSTTAHVDDVLSAAEKFYKAVIEKSTVSTQYKPAKI